MLRHFYSELVKVKWSFYPVDHLLYMLVPKQEKLPYTHGHHNTGTVTHTRKVFLTMYAYSQGNIVVDAYGHKNTIVDPYIHEN